MSCKISYIDSMTNIDDNTREMLNDTHRKIVRQLSAAMTKGNFPVSVFTFKNDTLESGRMVVSNHVKSPRYAEARRLVSSINTEYNPTGDPDQNIVSLIEDTEVTLKVSIDVRGLAGGDITFNEESSSNIFNMHKGESAIFSQPDDFTEMMLEHSKVFSAITASIKSKSLSYKDSRKVSPDKFRDNETEKNLKRLIAILEDPSVANKIEGISTYISIGSKSIQNLTTRIASIEELLATLPPNPEERALQIAKISDFVRQSSYYYHYFTVLKDISTQTKTLNIIGRAINNYDKHALETNLYLYLKDMGTVEGIQLFSSDEIWNMLDEVPDYIDNSAKLFKFFKDKFREKIGDKVLTHDEVETMQEKFDEALNKSMLKYGGIMQQLLNTIDKYDVIQQKLHDLHYESVTAVLHPIMMKAYNKFSAEDKKIAKDKGWVFTKEQFSQFLKMGSKDVGFIEYWLAAGINLNELLTQTTALMMKEIYINTSIKNKDQTIELQESVKKIGWFDKTEEEQKKIHKSYSHRNVVVVSPYPVDDDFEGMTTEITIFGRTFKVEARISENFLSEYDNLKYNNEKSVMLNNITEISQAYRDEMMEDKMSLTRLFTATTQEERNLANVLYKRIEIKGKTHYRLRSSAVKALEDSIDLEKLLLGATQKAFYTANINYVTRVEANNILIGNNIFDSDGKEIDINSIGNVNERAFIAATAFGNKMDMKSLRMTGTISPSSLYGFTNSKGVKKIMVKLTEEFDSKFMFMEFHKGKLLNPNNYDIAQYFTYNTSSEFSSLNKAKYHILQGGFTSESAAKWQDIKDDNFKREHFATLMQMYQNANKQLGRASLKYNEVPQVNKIDDVSTLTKVKESMSIMQDKDRTAEALSDLAGSYMVDNNKIPLRNYRGQNIDREGNILPPGAEPVFGTAQVNYANGKRIKHIAANFTNKIEVESIETDYTRSILLFNSTSNVYGILKQNESAILNLQTILQGDKKLDIDPRKMAALDSTGLPILDRSLNQAVSEDNRATQAILNMTNDLMYGESMHDFGILGSQISAAKMAKTLSTATSYMVLAWNFSTMPSNYLISLINERSVAEGNRFFNRKQYYEAINIYRKALMGGDFFKDFASKGTFSNKSFLTQLIIYFDAIQGEFLSPMGIIETKSIGEKLSESAAFLTQELVEHANQTQSMVMIMKGFILPANYKGEEQSLWDALIEANANRKDGELVKMPVMFTKELQVDFQLKLQGVNRIIHGNYSKLDKNNLQRTVVGNLMMTFKKFIYDGFRSRYMGERPDLELRTIEEGYFRTYIKAINDEFVQQIKPNAVTASMISKKGAKAIAGSFVKTTLGGLDAATFRLASKNSEGAKSFLYGLNPSERQLYASLRSTYEIGLLMRTALIVMVTEMLAAGLDEDDKITKKFLAYIDLYSRKVQGDLGLFISFTSFAGGIGLPGDVTLDQFMRIIKDPFVSYRSIDNSIQLFNQIFGAEWYDDEGNFDYQPHLFEQYKNSGTGYEKGDYKVWRKLQKSVLFPYWQIVRWMNPGQQLEYMDTMFRYSK